VDQGWTFWGLVCNSTTVKQEQSENEGSSKDHHLQQEEQTKKNGVGKKLDGHGPPRRIKGGGKCEEDLKKNPIEMQRKKKKGGNLSGKRSEQKELEELNEREGTEQQLH